MAGAWALLGIGLLFAWVFFCEHQKKRRRQERLADAIAKAMEKKDRGIY